MSLPPDIRPFFWEYAADALSWPESQGTIVPKLLRDGGQVGIDYLLSVMPSNELRDWLLAHDIRGIPPAQLRRLERQISLPTSWIRQRVKEYEDSVWGRRRGQ